MYLDVDTYVLINNEKRGGIVVELWPPKPEDPCQILLEVLNVFVYVSDCKWAKRFLESPWAYTALIGHLSTKEGNKWGSWVSRILTCLWVFMT